MFAHGIGKSQLQTSEISFDPSIQQLNPFEQQNCSLPGCQACIDQEQSNNDYLRKVLLRHELEICALQKIHQIRLSEIKKAQILQTQKEKLSYLIDDQNNMRNQLYDFLPSNNSSDFYQFPPNPYHLLHENLYLPYEKIPHLNGNLFNYPSLQSDYPLSMKQLNLQMKPNKNIALELLNSNCDFQSHENRISAPKHIKFLSGQRFNHSAREENTSSLFCNHCSKKIIQGLCSCKQQSNQNILNQSQLSMMLSHYNSQENIISLEDPSASMSRRSNAQTQASYTHENNNLEQINKSGNQFIVKRENFISVEDSENSKSIQNQQEEKQNIDEPQSKLREKKIQIKLIKKQDDGQCGFRKILKQDTISQASNIEQKMKNSANLLNFIFYFQKPMFLSQKNSIENLFQTLLNFKQLANEKLKNSNFIKEEYQYSILEKQQETFLKENFHSNFLNTKLEDKNSDSLFYEQQEEGHSYQSSYRRIRESYLTIIDINKQEKYHPFKLAQRSEINNISFTNGQFNNNQFNKFIKIRGTEELDPQRDTSLMLHEQKQQIQDYQLKNEKNKISEVFIIDFIEDMLKNQISQKCQFKEEKRKGKKDHQLQQAPLQKLLFDNNISDQLKQQKEQEQLQQNDYNPLLMNDILNQIKVKDAKIICKQLEQDVINILQVFKSNYKVYSKKVRSIKEMMKDTKFHNLNKRIMRVLLSILTHPYIIKLGVPLSACQFFQKTKEKLVISAKKIIKNTFVNDQYSHAHYNTLFLNIDQTNYSTVQASKSDTSLHLLMYNIDFSKPYSENQFVLHRANILKRYIFLILENTLKLNETSQDSSIQAIRSLYIQRVIKGMEKMQEGKIVQRF